MTGLYIQIQRRKNILFLSYLNPGECALWLLSTCRLKCKLLIKPHLLPFLSPFPHIRSPCKLRFFKHIFLGCASVTLNKPFCLVMLYCSLSFLPSKLLILQEQAQISPALRFSCSARQGKCLFSMLFISIMRLAILYCNYVRVCLPS